MSAFCAKDKGDAFGYEELAAVSGIGEPSQFEHVMETACRLALVQPSDMNRRYSIHSLLHEFTCRASDCSMPAFPMPAFSSNITLIFYSCCEIHSIRRHGGNPPAGEICPPRRRTPPHPDLTDGRVHLPRCLEDVRAHDAPAGDTARRDTEQGLGCAGQGASVRSPPRSFSMRPRISSRIGRTASMLWPAGSSSVQSS
jgi:hypothetical protein